MEGGAAAGRVTQRAVQDDADTVRVGDRLIPRWVNDKRGAHPLAELPCLVKCLTQQSHSPLLYLASHTDKHRFPDKGSTHVTYKVSGRETDVHWEFRITPAPESEGNRTAVFFFR